VAVAAVTYSWIGVFISTVALICSSEAWFALSSFKKVRLTGLMLLGGGGVCPPVPVVVVGTKFKDNTDCVSFYCSCALVWNLKPSSNSYIDFVRK
jgi:hypothetical protein